MQRASFAKPLRGARNRRPRGAIRPASGEAAGKIRSMKFSDAARKRAARYSSLMFPARKSPAPASRGRCRQGGLPCDGGVVSGMAMTMSRSAAA